MVRHIIYGTWAWEQGAVSIRKTVLPGMAIPMLKIRRPNGRLIFNMEIAIHIRRSLYWDGAQNLTKSDSGMKFITNCQITTNLYNKHWYTMLKIKPSMFLFMSKYHMVVKFWKKKKKTENFLEITSSNGVKICVCKSNHHRQQIMSNPKLNAFKFGYRSW